MAVYESYRKLNKCVALGDDTKAPARQSQSCIKQEVKVIWQKAPHGGGIPRLGVTPGGRNLYHWIHGVGVPISVP